MTAARPFEAVAAGRAWQRAGTLAAVVGMCAPTARLTSQRVCLSRRWCCCWGWRSHSTDTRLNIRTGAFELVPANAYNRHVATRQTTSSPRAVQLYAAARPACLARWRCWSAARGQLELGAHIVLSG